MNQLELLLTKTPNFQMNIWKRRFRQRISSNDGSATIEFLILALPLFLPLIVYLTNVYQDSHSRFDLQNYSRQLARAYVSSASEEVGISRIEMIRIQFGDTLFKKDRFKSSPSVEVHCSATPCLSKGSSVEVVVRAQQVGSGKNFISKTRESVDKWRD